MKPVAMRREILTDADLRPCTTRFARSQFRTGTDGVELRFGTSRSDSRLLPA